MGFIIYEMGRNRELSVFWGIHSKNGRAGQINSAALIIGRELVTRKHFGRLKTNGLGAPFESAITLSYPEEPD
jgi:hypothetical protein